MDIFVRGVPVQTTESALRDFFKPILERFSILRFYCTKFRNKPFAILTVTDVAKARLFLERFGRSTMGFTLGQLIYFDTRLMVSESRNKPNEIALRALRHEEEDLLRRVSRSTKSDPDNEAASHKPSQRKIQRRFDFSCLQCGTWDRSGRDTVFVSQFEEDRPKGRVVFGKKALAMILRATNQVGFEFRMDVPYWSIDTISTCSQTNRITFTLAFAPRIYRMADRSMEELFSNLGMLPQKEFRRANERARVSGIDKSHESVVGTCFAYRITLANPKDTSKVDHLVRTNRGMPSLLSLSSSDLLFSSKFNFPRDFQTLMDHIGPGCKYGDLAFPIKFQIERLARNAYLPPLDIVLLLKNIHRLSYQEGQIPTAMAIQMLARKIPIPGPQLDIESLLINVLDESLTQYAQEFEFEGSIYDSNSWNNNQCALVHRVTVTPTGMYLEGPEPEAGNRVLRQYRDHADHFLRVEFTDEDGDYVRFEPRTDLSEIFGKRFKGVLDGTIDIGGRSFEFLGFSHSSLRQRTCWFMSPITLKKGLVVTAQDVIKGLGDFSEIRCPAKCAARIGQAFSETTATVTISREMLQAMHDVVRNGRTFSDGVGTISSELLRRVCKHYGQNRSQKLTCLQIRFGGKRHCTNTR